MSRILVVYQSKTGFTKRYAELIAGALDACAADIRKVSRQTLSGCEVLIFGGRAHAGRLSGLSRAKRLYQRSGAKHFAVFATGATPNRAEETIEQFWDKNLSPKERAEIPHFYMQSGLCYEKMGFVDKFMMKGLSSMLKKKGNLTEEEQLMAKTIESSFDNSSPAYIEPLVRKLKEEAWN